MRFSFECQDEKNKRHVFSGNASEMAEICEQKLGVRSDVNLRPIQISGGRKIVRDRYGNAVIGPYGFKYSESPVVYGWPWESRGLKVQHFKLDGAPVSRQEFFLELRKQVQAYKRRFEHQLGISDEVWDLRGLRRHDGYIEVTKPPGESEYEEVFESSSRFYDGKIITQYHGTSWTNIKSILMDGMRESSDGLLGRGVYVGPLEKARAYINNASFRGKNWGRHGSIPIRTILELEVMLGRSLNVDEANTSNWGARINGKRCTCSSMDADSLYYGRFRASEYCLSSANQVRIRKIILI